MRMFTNYVIMMDAPEGAVRATDPVVINAFYAPDADAAAKIARAYIRTAVAATKDAGVSAIVKDRCHLRPHDMKFGDK